MFISKSNESLMHNLKKCTNVVLFSSLMVMYWLWSYNVAISLHLVVLSLHHHVIGLLSHVMGNSLEFLVKEGMVVKHSANAAY